MKIIIITLSDPQNIVIETNLYKKTALHSTHNWAHLVSSLLLNESGCPQAVEVSQHSIKLVNAKHEKASFYSCNGTRSRENIDDWIIINYHFVVVSILDMFLSQQFRYCSQLSNFHRNSKMFEYRVYLISMCASVDTVKYHHPLSF